VRPI
jgi:hypothetical protein